MTLLLSGTNGVSDVDGTAATPAIRGSDTNTGIFFPAADTIAFAEGGVESMRLDASGNLGVGTTSPVGRLNVAGADTSNAIGAAGASLNITNTDIAAFGRTVNLNFTVGNGNLTDRRLAGIAAIYTSFGTTTAGALAFATDNGSGSFAERMRLDSSGNLGLGTATPNNNAGYGGVTINGTTGGILDIKANGTDVMRIFGTATQSMVRTTTATPLLLGTNDLERARITSGGLFLCGTTSAPTSIAGTIGAVGYATRSGVAGGSFSGHNFNINWTAGSAALWIDNTNLGNIQLSSDYRIKKNIETQTAPALERVMRLRPVTYELADYGNLFKADGVQREGLLRMRCKKSSPAAQKVRRMKKGAFRTCELTRSCLWLSKPSKNSKP